MALLPMGSATGEGTLSRWESRSELEADPALNSGLNHGLEQGLHPNPGRDSGSQGSMFDEIPPAAGLEAYAAPSRYEPIEEPAYDSLEDFAQGISEPEATSFEGDGIHGGDAGFTPDSHAALGGDSGMAAEQPVWHSQESSEAAKPEPRLETTPEPSPAEKPMTVLTADDFEALEDRILRAVSLVRREREARILAEERVAALESQKLHFEAQSLQLELQCRGLESQLRDLEAQSPVLERLEQEIDALRIEREQVRQRVERLLSQLDSLEL